MKVGFHHQFMCVMYYLSGITHTIDIHRSLCDWSRHSSFSKVFGSSVPLYFTICYENHMLAFW